MEPGRRAVAGGRDVERDRIGRLVVPLVADGVRVAPAEHHHVVRDHPPGGVVRPRQESPLLADRHLQDVGSHEHGVADPVEDHRPASAQHADRQDRGARGDARPDPLGAVADDDSGHEGAMVRLSGPDRRVVPVEEVPAVNVVDVAVPVIVDAVGRDLVRVRVDVRGEVGMLRIAPRVEHRHQDAAPVIAHRPALRGADRVELPPDLRILPQRLRTLAPPTAGRLRSAILHLFRVDRRVPADPGEAGDDQQVEHAPAPHGGGHPVDHEEGADVLGIPFGFPLREKTEQVVLAPCRQRLQAPRALPDPALAGERPHVPVVRRLQALLFHPHEDRDHLLGGGTEQPFLKGGIKDRGARLTRQSGRQQQRQQSKQRAGQPAERRAARPAAADAAPAGTGVHGRAGRTAGDSLATDRRRRRRRAVPACWTRHRFDSPRCWNVPAPSRHHTILPADDGRSMGNNSLGYGKV